MPPPGSPVLPALPPAVPPSRPGPTEPPLPPSRPGPTEPTPSTEPVPFAPASSPDAGSDTGTGTGSRTDTGTEGASHDEPAADDRPAGRLRLWAERAALAVACAGAGLLVARWAGTSWVTAATIAGILLVVVPAAAWAAASVPGPDRPEN